MSNAGSALMGIGSARGEDRARSAAEMAVSSPLLEASIEGAHGVLLSIAGGSDLGLFEVSAAANLIQGAAHEEANIIFGTVIDERMGDDVSITVIATGFDSSRKRELHARTGTTTVPAGTRDYVRELADERQATAIPVQTERSVDPGLAPAATSAAPLPPPPARAASANGPSRGPQNEVEDLDIPAFLRRNR
jgi:cell division protein FtsZ